MTARNPLILIMEDKVLSQREEALAAGCSNFLIKPIKLTTLADKVTSYLPGG